MSIFVCFSSLLNLYKGLPLIGERENMIASFNIKQNAFFTILSVILFTYIKKFLITKNKDAMKKYRIMYEMVRNEPKFKMVGLVSLFNIFVEMLTCFLIKKIYEKEYKIGARGLAGFLIAPTIFRWIITRMVLPKPIEIMMSFYAAEQKVIEESD